jgi:uncharacterized protein YutE (UPF0331/DUF86 family)
MNSPAHIAALESVKEFLEGLRSRYEAEGFTFTVAPDKSMLPAFMGSYIPDALARKPGRNIAIEVKSRQSAATQAQLQDIRRLFESHPDWQFSVFFSGSGSLPSVTIPRPSPTAIRERIGEVRQLVEQGHQRAAFVMAWSLVEAAFRADDENEHRQPLTPGTVVQTLAMNGYIGPDTERSMRGLIALRNQIVHGDVVAEPTAEDVNLLLSAVEEALQVGVS